MNSIQMSFYPLNDGTLVNVSEITNIHPSTLPTKESEPWIIQLTGGRWLVMSEDEYQRFKSLYCPPTQTVL